MTSKRPTDDSEGSAAADAISGTDDTAFDRLLQEAAKVPVAGRLLSPGTTLCEGRFVIRRRLGEGGMGVVFEGLDTRSDAPVAIKTLSRVDAAGIYRLKNEFRSLAGVTHRHLVSLYELFADGELWFFTMSLLEGVRFDQYLAARSHQLQAVLAQLCAGVQAVHDAGKLHRDLKPSNVLVRETADGPEVSILDFGLTSEVSRPGATQTIERGVAGTPAYMAPEQARGHNATLASDWYAVGVMLFEVLTGRLPFEGTALEQLLAKQTKPAPAVCTLAPQAPADLAALCDALLCTDPAARPTPKQIHQSAGSAVELPTGPSQPASRGSSSAPGAEHELASLTPSETFVGRTREIGQLATALGDTNNGKPVFVKVAGPSGIGKTTFVEHFLSAAKARGDAVVLWGRCYERESVPFKGFDGVIDALSRYLVRLPDARAQRLMPRQAQALARVFPVLGRVEAISSAPQRRGLPSDPIELRVRAFEALKELLAKLAEERPLIVYIDDLQWSDRDSARLLKHLLTPPDPPLLLLVATHRDDEPDAEGLLAVREALAEHAADNTLDMRTIELGALSSAESRRLAEQLLPPGQSERVARVAREGCGSPFLIGELSRAAHHSENPGDLRSAILTRVAALPETQRAVLHALCVAPRPVTLELLSRVVEHADVPAELRALLSGHLAREVAAIGGGRRLSPYHDRIRETLLEALPTGQRSDWHARYTAVLEAREPLDLDALVDHALGAGQRDKAGDYARRAARAASEAFAWDRAVLLYETALAHLALSDVERAELLSELGQTRAGSGRCGEAARTFLQAAELDPSRAQELQRRAGAQFWINGELQAGADSMRQALTSAGFDFDALTDPAAQLPGYTALLQRGFAFEPRPASEIKPAQRERLETLWAAALGANYLLHAPMLTVVYLREALEVGDPLSVAKGRALLLTLEAAFDPASAQRRLPEVVALLEALDTPMTRAWIPLCRGWIAFLAGCDDLGLADLQTAEELLNVPENRGMLRELNACRHMVAAALWVRSFDACSEQAMRWMRFSDAAGDRSARTMWRCQMGPALYEHLGANRARAEVSLGVELSEGLAQPRMHALVSLARIEAMEDNLEAALRHCEPTFKQLKGRDWFSLNRRFERALCLLRAVARGVGDRAVLLSQVHRDAAILAQPRTMNDEPVRYAVLAGCAEFLQGELAAAAGNLTEARMLFEAAVTAAHGGPFAHFFSARLGELVGGARGAELRAEAEAGFVALGYRSPNWRRLWMNGF